MAPRTTAKRVLLAALASILGLVLLGPPIAAELLYRYELARIGAPPPLAAGPLPPGALAAFWAEAGENLPMKTEVIWKWHFPLWLVRRSWPAPMARGERIASLAARAWLAERPAVRGGLRRQLDWGTVTVWMSRNWSAEEMTRAWISRAWFGRDASGLEAAAVAYFGRPATELESHQLAFLVGLTQSPRRYDPDCRPEDAQSRRDYILGRLLAEGVLTSAEHDDAVAQPLGVVPRGCQRE
jgi:hypothetical protein